MYVGAGEGAGVKMRAVADVDFKGKINAQMQLSKLQVRRTASLFHSFPPSRVTPSHHDLRVG